MIDNIIILIHIICGAALFIIAPIMQLVVGPALSKIEQASEKQKAAGALKGIMEPLMKTFIVLMTLSASYLLYTRWFVIAASPMLSVKVTFGAIALLFANILHFYIRGLKIRLAETDNRDRLSAIQKMSIKMERVVLIGASTAYLLGVFYNHLNISI